MAQVEKVTFQPLIDFIKEHNSYLNSLLVTARVRFSGFNDAQFSNWVTTVLVPIAQSVYTYDEHRFASIMKRLFSITIDATSTIQQSETRDLYMRCWLLFVDHPMLLTKNSGELLFDFHTALGRVREHNVEKCELWIELLRKNMQYVSTLNEAKILGRIIAWRCGLSHLKSKALTSLASLPETCLSEIFTSGIPLPKNPPKGEILFRHTLGGYAALGGIFLETPQVYLDGDLVIATDSLNSYVLFADEFGATYTPYPKENDPKRSSEVTQNELIDTFLSEYRDITSAVITKALLCFTLRSSYSVMILGGCFA